MKSASFWRGAVAATMLVTAAHAGGQTDLSTEYLWQPDRIAGDGWVVGTAIHRMDSHG
jgi:hypothetical protein